MRLILCQVVIRDGVLFGVCAAALALASCGGDEDVPPEGAPLIVTSATPYAKKPDAIIVNVGTPPPEITPRPQPTPIPTPTPQPVTYRVKTGDVPGSIANQFGITVAELLAANGNIAANSLQLGQDLIIPGRFVEPTPTPPPSPTATGTPPSSGTPRPGATPTSTATPTPRAGPTPTATATTAPTPEPEVYIVEAGDAALSIANRFGITLAQLAAANSTTEAALRDLQIGQVLYIPRNS